jgi:hypothetical protein
VVPVSGSTAEYHPVGRARVSELALDTLATFGENPRPEDEDDDDEEPGNKLLTMTSS